MGAIRGRHKVREIILRIVEEVREKGKVNIKVMAWKYGYSYNYLRYSLIPQITEIFGDIRIIKEGGKEYLVSS